MNTGARGSVDSGETRGLRRGDVVEVGGLEEILATLDARGTLEGLPFMPEMAQFCGRQFRVFRRVNKVYFDFRYHVGRVKPAVLLEDVRCDGSAHGGCQVGCLALWKAAWLKRVGGGGGGDVGGGTEGRRGQSPVMPRPTLVPTKGDSPLLPGPVVSVELPTMRGDKFSCQATQLIEAATRLSGWDLREYVRDYFEGDRGLGELSRILLLRIHNRIRWGLGWPPYRNVTGKQTKTPTAELRLQPGELVRVKDRAEIEATLDRLGRNRGLAFAAEMVRYCGGKYRVARRVERMIIEWTGELREMPNTVALEGVTCSGIAQQGCPRACFHLWREIWLRRAE